MSSPAVSKINLKRILKMIEYKHEYEFKKYINLSIFHQDVKYDIFQLISNQFLPLKNLKNPPGYKKPCLAWISVIGDQILL